MARDWASASSSTCSARGVLLHLVDMLPPDPGADPVRDARAIVNELKKFDKQSGQEAALAGDQ